MKRFIISLIVIAGFLVLLIITSVYDRFIGGDDGYIQHVAFKRVFLFLGIELLLFLVLIAGFRSKQRLIQHVSLAVFSAVTVLFLLELLMFTGFKTGLFKNEAPKHRLFKDVYRDVPSERPFWGDYHKDFAKWCLPNDTLQRVNCAGDSLLVTTNSYGAIDTERRKQSEDPRVIILGDSFFEGFMVNAEHRMSNLLEDMTGREHLNFAINGTSPINYLLTYQHLAKNFQHEVVIVGILPGNDFSDFTSAKKNSLINSPIYRPYWDGRYPDFSLKYSLASVAQSIYSQEVSKTPTKLNAVIDSTFRSLSGPDKIVAFLYDNSYLWAGIDELRNLFRMNANASYSGFDDYTKAEWEVFSFSLRKLLEQAHGKKVIFTLLPIMSDMQQYDPSRESRLVKDLEALFGENPDVQIIDFRPVTQQYSGALEDLYVLCDGHWSKSGEKLAAEILLNHTFYRESLSLPPMEISGIQ